MARLKVQYIPRNMHTVFALLCFVVVIHWLICPYPSALLHWHCGNLTIAPVPAKQPWWMDKYFMWIHYERLHNHNKAKHNKTVCIFLGICCNCFGVNCSLWSRHALCLHTCSSSYNSWKPFAAMVIFLFLANIVPNTIDLNTSPPRAAYMRQGTGSALVEIMPYRLFAAKHYLN